MNSRISLKAQKGLKSKIHGRGLFSLKPIKKGEIVAIKRGNSFTWKQLKKIGLSEHYYLQIEDDVYLGPRTEKEAENSLIYINHSCNPNTGMKGKKTIIAIKNIKNGEEIFIDYAMCYHGRLSAMRCNCGSKNCRKKITADDWKNPELQKKYKGYFSSFIQSKINKISKQ